MMRPTTHPVYQVSNETPPGKRKKNQRVRSQKDNIKNPNVRPPCFWKQHFSQCRSQAAGSPSTKIPTENPHKPPTDPALHNPVTVIQHVNTQPNVEHGLTLPTIHPLLSCC